MQIVSLTGKTWTGIVIEESTDDEIEPDGVGVMGFCACGCDYIDPPIPR